jgi:hypothetical protein
MDRQRAEQSALALARNIYHPSVGSEELDGPQDPNRQAINIHP